MEISIIISFNFSSQTWCVFWTFEDVNFELLDATSELPGGFNEPKSTVLSVLTLKIQSMNGKMSLIEGITNLVMVNNALRNL